MLHRTVWDAPSASSKREVSFRLETGGGYVTPICMECAVRQFDKEVSFTLGKGVENVTSICLGRAVRQFDKEVRFKLGTR